MKDKTKLVGAGVLGGLLIAAVLVIVTGSDSTTRSILMPSPSLAHAAKGAPLKSVADVAERSLPSVVNISTTRKHEAAGSQFEMNPFFKDFFRHFGPRR